MAEAISVDRRVQLICCWISIASIAALLVGFFVVSGYVPPVHANETALQVAHFYRSDNGRIRAGLAVMFVSWIGYAPFTVVLSGLMNRIEGARTLAVLQLVGGIVGWVFLLIPEIVLAVAAFRPERSPEATQTLHDLGWFLAFLPIVPFEVQAISLGAAILLDPQGRPTLPRWSGYLSLWCAFLFLPGIILMFVKSGPFAYHGLFVFWIPMFAFGTWILVMSLVARQSVLREGAP